MEKNILLFGTYNVPLTGESLSASFTVPSIASKEMLDNFVSSQKSENKEENNKEENKKESKTKK